MLSDLISSELPYLRRYARGLMGEQQNGDEAVEDMIESLIFRFSVAPDLKFQKADLFAELDKSISKRVSTLTDETGIAKILNAMTTLQRRSLLLTVVEGFSVQEAARILSVGVPDVEEMLRTAESAIANEVSTSNLVDTLEPATIATMGCSGACMARPNASSSFANNGPAQAIFAKRATPSVEASARCAVPKASFT